MKKEKIIILGGGLAGLSTAYHLEKLDSHYHYQIFEKEDRVGGLCSSKKAAGFTFDIDGHLLHFKRRSTLTLLKEVMGDGLIEHQRNSWVYSCGSYIRYPFQANLFGLPLNIVKSCLLGFIQALNNSKNLHSQQISFKKWVIQTFGQGIARHFMLPYNRKFWTVPLNELTCQWVDGFIPVPGLADLIEGTVSESKKRYGYNASFWYPKKGGIGQLALSLSKRIKNLQTSQEAKRIDLSNKKIVFQDGRKIGYDKLVSTIALPELAKVIEDLPRNIIRDLNSLKWTSIFNLNLGIDRENLSEKHWIYFPDEELVFYRVGFPHNFSPSLSPANKSSLYVEVSYSPQRPIQKKNLVQHIIEDLKKVRIISSDDKILVKDANDIKYAYVIYDKNRNAAVENIIDFLSQHDVFSLGRFGSWKYMSMEDSILEGKHIAESWSKD